MDGDAVACGDFHQVSLCWHGHGTELSLIHDLYNDFYVVVLHF